MKIAPIVIAATLALGSPLDSAAQTRQPEGHHAHHAKPTPAVVPANVQAAVAVVDRFGNALADGDLKTVESLLDPEVLILETGGAERSRDEYMKHHAISDAKFLKGSHRQLKHRTTRRAGDVAWIGSESELHTTRDAKPVTLLSTETMILKKSGEEWRIVHIHWSSRPQPSK